MIVVNELKKQFGSETVLKKISFNVSSGDRFGILGTSGGGKSTLLRCINGIETFQGGEMRTLNQRVTLLSEKELRNLKKQIGMVFQHDSLLERKNVLENVMLPLECSGMKKGDAQKKAAELLQMVGLQEKVNEKSKNLSGGQRQRVAIARALSLEPKILLCDEATSALDPKSTFEILDLLHQLNQDYQLTLVVVTHQIEVIKRLCNKVVILEQGEIKENDIVKNLFFRNPPALRRITGEKELVVEEGKILVKILIDIQKLNLIERLNRSNLPEWQLIYSTTETFYDELLTLMIISVGKEHKNTFTKFLDDWQIRNESVGNNQW